MPITPPGPEPSRNRPDTERYTASSSHRAGVTDAADPTTAKLASLGIWRGEPLPARTPPTAMQQDEPPHPADQPIDPAEHERLRAENEELRALVVELRAMLDESAAKEAPAAWQEREREYESLLEEKSEVIRTLHLKIRDLEEQASTGGQTGSALNEKDLLELSDELDRERAQMEQERRQMDEIRRQLQEDEEAMMQQMRDMEMQMSRERAELARQRNELQRLHNEIRHELEAAQRDSLLNERLRMLQRKHQEAANRRGGEPGQPATPPPAPQQPPAPAKKDSGLLRSLFGRRND